MTFLSLDMHYIPINQITMNPDRTSEPDRIAYGPEALKTRCRTDENNKDWIRPQDAVHAMMLELGAPPDNVDVKSVTIYTPETAVGTFVGHLDEGGGQYVELKMPILQLALASICHCLRCYQN